MLTPKGWDIGDRGMDLADAARRCTKEYRPATPPPNDPEEETDAELGRKSRAAVP